MDLSELLAGKHVRTVFQPIVDLDEGTVVAFEALTRAPAGALAGDALFAAARAEGCLGELDALCRSTALRTAVAVGLACPLSVFVNIEPDVLDLAALDELIDIADNAPGGLDVVLEITERAIASRPAELLACVRRLRESGWRVALDDVGADDMSLAFMPLLRPDIVKLDLNLIQDRPGPAVAGIMHAVNAYAQRSGAIVLAEGIEDEQHLELARALGARLGQGWMFGRPSPTLAVAFPPGALQFAPVPAVVGSRTSPFACLPADQPVRRSTKPLLIELSRHLEREALRYGSTCVVIATFQDARHFTPRTATVYRELAERIAFVAAVGAGLSTEPAPGVRGADIADHDPLRNEWDITVLAPHFAAALLARDLGDTGPDHSRRFEFAVTYDRDTVAAAAESLLSRVLPASWTARAGAHTSLAPGGQPDPGHTRAAIEAASSAQLRRALGATSNGVSIADVTRPDHPLIYVNTAFERLSGHLAVDILGTNCRIMQGPDTDPAAIRRMREAIAQGREFRDTILNYRPSSEEYWWNEIYLAPIFDDDGRLIQYIGIQNDVTARVHAETELHAEQQRSVAYLAEIETMAFHDPLTGLLNRRKLNELLPDTLADAASQGRGVGFLYLDVDGFKHVNDTLGHAVGDAVLTELSVRLRARQRPGDLTFRLGGDEFLVVLCGLDDAHAAEQAKTLAKNYSHPLAADIVPLPLTVSIGISTFPQDGADFDALLHAADLRMYLNKAQRAPGDDRRHDSGSIIEEPILTR